MFLTYTETIVAIHFNEDQISFKYSLGRKQTHYWNQVKNIIIGFPEESQIWLRIGKNTYEFCTDKFTFDNIIFYYNKVTGRQPISPQEFFDLKENP